MIPIRPPIARVIALAASCCLAGCGDITVRTVPASSPASPTTPEVPQQLLGLWQGLWYSDWSPTAGVVEVRIQHFEGQPVLDVSVQHPCLPSSGYELVLLEDRIVLQVAGERVFDGQLVSSVQIGGTYSCPNDEGRWGAILRETLPDPDDLGGTWLGGLTFGVAGTLEPVVLTLDQFVESGALVLEGTLDLPTLLPAPVQVRGRVAFDAHGFQLGVESQPESAVQFVLTAVGGLGDVTLDDAWLQVGNASLPFSQALVQLERQPD